MSDMTWKPRGYESPEWNNPTEIMRDQSNQISNLTHRLEKHKAEIKRLNADRKERQRLWDIDRHKLIQLKAVMTEQQGDKS